MINKEFVLYEYQSGKTSKEIAKTIGCTDAGIRRILRNYGIKLRQKKYCPALIGMLIDVLEMSTTEIASCYSIPIQSVNSILTNKYPHLKQSRIYAKDIDLDALEAEYLAGASTYELGEKYGVYHTTISKWMKQRGHIRGKGYTTQEGTNKGHETQTQRAIARDKQRLLAEGGKIELVEYGGSKSTYRCTDCGLVFDRWRGYGQRVVCPDCYSREIAEQKAINDTKREEARKKSEQARAEEYAKDKICKSCGCVFHNESPRAKFCSRACSRREKRHRDVEAGKTLLTSSGNHRKRARIYGVAYEPGITVKKLIKRDNNICQICGEPCDSNDHRWSEHFGPLYPTIDHIIAMVNGGGHTWDNVQLAHAICNSVKRDLAEEELTEEVITHAKEQAITDKCA